MTITTAEDGQRARYLNLLAEEFTRGEVPSMAPAGVRPPPNPSEPDTGRSLLDYRVQEHELPLIRFGARQAG